MSLTAYRARKEANNSLQQQLHGMVFACFSSWFHPFYPFAVRAGTALSLVPSQRTQRWVGLLQQVQREDNRKGKPGRESTHQGNGEEKTKSLHPHSESETELSVITTTYPSDFLCYSNAQIPTLVPWNPHWSLIALFSLLLSPKKPWASTQYKHPQSNQQNHELTGQPSFTARVTAKATVCTVPPYTAHVLPRSDHVAVGSTSSAPAIVTAEF